MKLVIIIVVLLCSVKSQAQSPSLSSFSTVQQGQLKAYVKYVTDSSLAVSRKEVKAWTDNKRTIDSTQNINLKKDSADFVTLKTQVGALIIELKQYQLIETIPMTPDELDAFNKFLDKIKNLATLLK